MTLTEYFENYATESAIKTEISISINLTKCISQNYIRGTGKIRR
jgi:hypothetical protein